MSRSTNLVEGTVFTMDKELKAEIPLQHKLAAMELSNQFHKVVADDWSGSALHVIVYRDKDTVNPTYYDVVQLHDNRMVRRECNNRGHEWNIYSTDPKPAPKPAVERAVRRRHKPTPSTVTAVNDSTNIQRLFVQRAEINDELRTVELLFTRDPQPQHVSKMFELRKDLTKLENQIVMMAATKEFDALSAST